MMSLKVTGVDKVLAGFADATKRLRSAFDAAMFTQAGEVADVAVDNAPKKTGQLRASVFVERSSPARVGFGARHAAITHETGPRKKFLQRALSDGSARARSRLASLTMQYAVAGTTLASVPARHPESASPPWPSPTTSGRRRPSASRRRLP